MFTKLAPIAFAAFALASASVSSAQAQTALTNGVSLTTGAQSQTTYNSVNLGSTGGTGVLSNMPLSLSYAEVDLSISFTGNSGVYKSGTSYNPTPGSNFLYSRGGASTLQFSAAQQYFGLGWSSPDDQNSINFYNGETLLASMTGTQFRTAASISYNSTAYAGFSFSELGFDKIVLSSATSGFEAGDLRFASAEAIDVAPIPLNAASLGGLMSFLMMLGMRGKGGPQVTVRMAFASIMPRRRTMA